MPLDNQEDNLLDIINLLMKKLLYDLIKYVLTFIIFMYGNVITLLNLYINYYITYDLLFNLSFNEIFIYIYN
jgi:hypothetical protein